MYHQRVIVVSSINVKINSKKSSKKHYCHDCWPFVESMTVIYWIISEKSKVVGERLQNNNNKRNNHIDPYNNFESEYAIQHTNIFILYTYHFTRDIGWTLHGHRLRHTRLLWLKTIILVPDCLLIIYTPALQLELTTKI